MSHVVLVVEDETDIRKILCFNLRSEGYEVLEAGSAEKGMKLMSGQVSLILLDVMLPGMSGFEMARKLREHDGSTVPIIFMTALGDEEDILEGFSSGADDYISKPFSFNELNARIKAILRRTGGASQDKVIQISGLRIDTEKGTVCSCCLPGTPAHIFPARPSSTNSGKTHPMFWTGPLTYILPEYAQNSVPFTT